MREYQRLQSLKLASTSLEGEESAKKKLKSTVVNIPRGSYHERLLQAGIVVEPRLYVVIVIGAAFGVGWVLSFLGIFISLFASISLMQYLFLGFLSERASKRRRKVIPQFPAFIDSLAAALGAGMNLEAAVIQAALSVPPGLFRSELDRVVDALNRGLPLDDSLGILSRRIAGREVTSLIVCLKLFYGMGGRLLEPFKRLGRKIREQQQVAERANRDLVQVKQAFLVLMLLSVSAPGVLMLISPDYMGLALTDSVGLIALQIGVGLQITALLIFKAVTNLNL